MNCVCVYFIDVKTALLLFFKFDAQMLVTSQKVLEHKTPKTEPSQ